MTNNGFYNGAPSLGHSPRGANDIRWIPEIVRHLTLVLAGLVRRLHQEGLPVPRDVEGLAMCLVRLARSRQDPSSAADELETAHPTPAPDRLLVTKGDAAERLGVSVRTIERLVAAGRLRQVQVERLARFRVSDLEKYVDSLSEESGPTPETNGDRS